MHAIARGRPQRNQAAQMRHQKRDRIAVREPRMRIARIQEPVQLVTQQDRQIRLTRGRQRMAQVDKPVEVVIICGFEVRLRFAHAFGSRYINVAGLIFVASDPPRGLALAAGGSKAGSGAHRLHIASHVL